MSMKHLLFLCLIWPGALSICGQNMDNSRRDWVWPLGYDYYSDSIGVDAVTFDFSGVGQGDTMRITYGEQDFEMEYANASVCDSNGQLLIYTNGCQFGDVERKRVLDSFMINVTNAHELACFGTSGLRGSRQILMVPDSYDPSTFHLFSEPISIFDFGLRSKSLLYQKIEYATTSFVLEVNDLALKTIDSANIKDSSFNICHLSACLHGNGKDWWIITSLIEKNSFQKFLLTNNGVSGPYTQEVGVAFDVPDGATGNSVFSPDGTKFVDYAVQSGFFNHLIYGIYLTGNPAAYTVTIKDNAFQNVEEHTIYADQISPIRNLQVTDNAFNDNDLFSGGLILPRSGLHIRSFTPGMQNSVVFNNTFLNSPKPLPFGFANRGVWIRNLNGSHIEQNIFTDNFGASPQTYEVVSLFDASTQLWGNTFTGPGNFAGHPSTAIQVQESPACWLSCNTADQTRAGWEFQGQNSDAAQVELSIRPACYFDRTPSSAIRITC